MAHPPPPPPCFQGVVKFPASSKPEATQSGATSPEKDDDGERRGEIKGSGGTDEARGSRDLDSSEGLSPQSVSGGMLGKHSGGAITMKLKTQVK